MSMSNTCFSFEEIDKIFKKSKKIFFIGIGGISQFSLASYCAFCGKEVFGYDRARSKETRKLESICNIKYYSTPDNVDGMDMVIYTLAIDEGCFEYKRAKENKIPLISRANFLGYIISKYKKQIAICGMHGKSTTTSMLGHIFEYASRRESILCGAEMKEFSSPYVFNSGECVIYEACEYKNSFHCLPKTDVALLNIDFDHPDFFSSIDEIKDSFKKFCRDSERVFINVDDEYSKCIEHNNIITYGIENNATYFGKIEHTCNKNVFSVYKNGMFLCTCELNFFGKHFVLDALCAFAVSHENGIAPSVISRALATFEGNERRMELVGKTDTGAPIFLDYAHHPNEINVSLSALKEKYGKILCVFQSHTYSRTYFLYDEFTRAFTSASKVLVLPIYPAREKNIYPLSEERFALQCGGIYIEDFCAVSKEIKASTADAVVIMGAGDIYKLVKML